MNFPYVLSDEILLRSKYEKKMEKKLRSKWLSVTINVFADHVTTNKDNHAEIIPNQPPATEVPTICWAQSFRQTEIDIDGNTSSIDMKYHVTTQASNFGMSSIMSTPGSKTPDNQLGLPPK